MAKKVIAENIEEVQAVELTESVEAVKPVAEQKKPEPVQKAGYIRIRKKGKDGNGIVVHTSAFGEGKMFGTDIWEAYGDAKKK